MFHHFQILQHAISINKDFFLHNIIQLSKSRNQSDTWPVSNPQTPLNFPVVPVISLKQKDPVQEHTLHLAVLSI